MSGDENEESPTSSSSSGSSDPAGEGDRSTANNTSDGSQPDPPKPTNPRGEEDDSDEQDEPRQPQQGGEEGKEQPDGEHRVVAEAQPNAEDATSYQKRWAEMYQRLVTFKEKHGHCRVPNRYDEDTQLGYWVSTQRRQRRLLSATGNDAVPLSLERAKKLEDIGFEWSAVPLSHKSWDGRYAELCDFVAKKGHAQVPMGYEENPRLATWVSTQRQEYKLLKQGRSSRLTEAKKKKLDDVGFVWEAQRGRRKVKLEGSEKETEGSVIIEGDDDERKQPAKKGSPRPRLKQPPPGSPSKNAKKKPSKKAAAAAKPQSSTAQELAPVQFRPQPSISTPIQSNPAPATPHVSTIGEEPSQPSLTRITDAATLDRVSTLLAQQSREGPAGSAVGSMAAFALGQGSGIQTNTVGQLNPAGSAPFESSGLSLGGFSLNQGTGTNANTVALRQAVAAHTSSALLEQDLLRHLAGGAANRGQSLGISRHQAEENALQSFLLRSNMSANVAGTNLANVLEAQARQRTAQDQQNLLNQRILHQLVQQQQHQEQQRQLQQLEALRSLQALNAQQALGLSLPVSSLLLQSNPSVRLLPTTQHQQDHLSLQHLLQPDVSLEELQQSQLRAARQSDARGSLLIAQQGTRSRQVAAASLEEKSSERDDSGTGDRKRSALPSGKDRKSYRRS